MIWIEQLADYSGRYCKSWPNNPKIALINNPFGDDWEPEFVFNLTCERHDVTVERIRYPNGSQGPPHFPKPFAGYASVAFYTGNAYIDYRYLVK